MNTIIAIGADHGGLLLKNELVLRLGSTFQLADLGATTFDPADDYPDIALRVALFVASGQAERGIIICGSGVGASIAANKVDGIRACVCHDTYSAHQGVEHDDMNVLCLGCRVIGAELAEELVRAFLGANFTAEARHERRLNKINLIENNNNHPAGSFQLSVGPVGAIKAVKAELEEIEKLHIIDRLWQKDYTLWKPQPDEITNRLGWLAVTDLMSSHLQELLSFAREVATDGFKHVLVLGMGGSSLGPEVLRQSFGHLPDYPELVVLDSTEPSHVQSVAGRIDPARTLCIVSSKSGTTTEPLLLLSYFKKLIEDAVGKDKAATHLAVITDPGTPLAKTAEDQGFRKIFLNPGDIGGRYSVLSYFGLVPAALVGININLLIQRAQASRQSCTLRDRVENNPGAWLGAFLAAMVKQGRDKLTLICSKSINSFGLWVEQLIAESLGKDGKGIIPVVGEPLLAPAEYCNDRAFVYLRMDADDNSTEDTAVENLRLSGQPLIVSALKDKYDLAVEFYQWEFAIAIAGSLLGIQPFDQPDVQKAKVNTERVLNDFTKTGRLPDITSVNSLDALLKVKSGNPYLAVMAYFRQTEELDRVISRFRANVTRKYGIATTSGYGPRFLHSTGQLHKGGPVNGVFLQITANHTIDLPVPDKPYSFGVVIDAQSAGDYEALKSLDRPVIRIHLKETSPIAVAEALTQLIS